MATSSYIEDGFTVEDTYPGGGWTKAFKFRYRPALPARIHKYLRDQQVDPENRHRTNVKLIMERIDSWDLKGRDNAVLPIVESAFDRIAIKAQNFLVNCILGDGPDHVDFEEAAKN